MKRQLSRFAVVCCAVILTACGWHLRGSDTTTQLASNSVYLSGQPGETYALIEQRLRTKNALTSLNSAQYHLVIDKENWKRRKTSSSNSGATREYQLRLSINYKILNNNQEVLRPSKEARLSRAYTFDENDAAGKDKEEQLVRQDIRRAAARQILQQLQLLQRQ